MSESDVLNYNDGDGSSATFTRQTSPRLPKKVQFPTLQEIDKNIPPPGSTPTSSWTNIFSPKSIEKTLPKPIKPKAKLIHSSTSLEVEADGASSLTSVCTTFTHSETATTSTYVIETPPEHYSCNEQLAYQPPRLPPKKRCSSLPANRTVGTQPKESSENFNQNKAKSNNSGSTVSPSSSRNYDTKLFRNSTGTSNRSFSGLSGFGFSKSILRKSLLPVKDANSNFMDTNVADPKQSNRSTAANICKSVDDSFDSPESIKNEMWEHVGKSCIPLAAAPSSRGMSRRGRQYRTPRTKSTLSSNGSLYSGREVASYGSNSISADGLSSMTESSGGMEANKQLSNLTNILTTLRQKEVIFDRASAIQALQARILRGERVTHEEIKAIRNMTLPTHQRHLGYRLPWSTDLYCVKGLIHIPTPNKQPSSKNTFGTIEDLRLPFSEHITMEHYGRRHYVVNLAGFEDDDISLYLEGKNRLVIRAERLDSVNGEDIPTTVTETILLPPDLPADNLRIVRKPSGTTIIEESWRF